MAGIPSQACALGPPAATEKGGAGRGGRPPHPGAATAPGDGGAQDGAAGTSRPGIQGFEVQGRLVEGAEQTGETGPQMPGRKREEEPNTARRAPGTAAPALRLLAVPAGGTQSPLRGQLYWTVPSASCELTHSILTTTLRSSYNSGTESQGGSVRGPRSQS